MKRVWWAFAAVWWFVGLAGFIYFWNIGGSFFYRKNPLFGHPFQGGQYKHEWEHIIVYSLIVVLFPLILVGAWKFIQWIKEGFKEEKPPILEDKE